TAGILHDLWLYCNFPLERDVHKIHDEIGSRMAEEILESSGKYSKDDINLICRMIFRHNKKDETDGVYEEVLKDADALQHYTNNSDYDKRYNYHGRIEPLLDEFGIS
ncbi:MAG: HD domain-containing protein, partial [Clostridiales bacterium]|nr:HD domain-containing protein [Clostridiales bacterium]